MVWTFYGKFCYICLICFIFISDNNLEEKKKKDMFSFFRKSQDSKKVMVPEREADGFVIVGKWSFCMILIIIEI